jgi:hypothetical protein
MSSRLKGHRLLAGLLFAADHYVGKVVPAILENSGLTLDERRVYNSPRTRTHIAKSRSGDTPFISAKSKSHALAHPIACYRLSQHEKRLEIIGLVKDGERAIRIVIEMPAAERREGRGWLVIQRIALARASYDRP